MGDSETIVDTSTSYPSSNYVGVGTETVPMAGDTGLPVSSTTPMDTAQSESASTEYHGAKSGSDSVMQDAVVSTSNEVNPPLGGGTQTVSGVQSTTTELNAAASYDFNSNGDVTNASAAGATENGDASAEAQGTVLHQPPSDALSAEEERLWNIVRANSLDFTAWTSLVEETEKSGKNPETNIVKIRKVYDAFLAEFPLCYGYWKKYADHELNVGALDKVVEVYERAVQGVTYSVDIWLHYCVFAISTYGDPDTIRRLFERGLAYVGTDYLSYPLWDKYIEYEYTQQEWGRLTVIYTRILENPNHQLDRYFNSFKELAGSRPLSELRTAEEAAKAAEGQTAERQDTEGEVQPGSADLSDKAVNDGTSEAEELEKYIACREDLYKKAKEFESKIIDFERNIRRPYFHVKALSEAELQNWHLYLDFIEKEGDFSEEVKLYERCLVACASYSEYWIRYILRMEAKGSMDLSDNALARATQVFVKRQPEIHLFAAYIKEQHGDIDGARAAYQLVHSETPGLIEAIIKHANMEKRLGKMEDAFSLYEQAISIEKGKEHSQTLPMLFAQYSRFVYLVYGNAEKARDIIVQALEQGQLSKPLLEALIYFESNYSIPKRIDYLDSLVEKFIVPDSDNANAVELNEKEELSNIFLEFLDLFGDAQSIKKAKERHCRYFLAHKSYTVSRKREAEDMLGSDKSKLAKYHSTIVTTAPSAASTYPAVQTQWPAGYGSQPQQWPQVPQAQTQTWNPSYPQQAGYGGYYGNYAQPQVPAAAPQTVAYGAYPPSYTAQAYPQQTYVAPATGAAPASVQQPAPAPVAAAAAPQAYYGAYY